MRNSNDRVSTPAGSVPMADTVATTRRGFLAFAGLGAAGVMLASCGSSDDTTTSTASSAAGTSGTVVGGTATSGAANSGAAKVDLDTATFAAGLEVLAVQTYTAAAGAASMGALGTVPPAVGEYVGTALAHHQAALDKWNAVLKAGGKAAVTEPNAKLKPTVDAALAKVTNVGGAAALALMLEEIASATYQKAVPTLTDKAATELAGSLQIIDAQHVAILLFVAGQYPVPETFAKTEKAAS